MKIHLDTAQKDQNLTRKHFNELTPLKLQSFLNGKLPIESIYPNTKTNAAQS